jgi:hypothetical protein
MQTLDFTRALTEIVKELKVKELFTLLQPWLVSNPTQPPNHPTYAQSPLQEPQKSSFQALIFESRSAYDRLLAVESTRKILDGMGGKELYESARLARLVTLVSTAGQIVQLRANPEMYDFFQTLSSFLKMEKTCTELLERDKIGRLALHHSLLELQLTDYEGNGIEPERLAAAFSTLADLQMNLARLLRVEDYRLTVKYLDSGSDFKFGIEGVGEAINAMRDLFFQFWDRIRFRDYDSLAKDIEAITKAVEFMGKVSASVEANAITAEEANVLKAVVFKQVDNLVKLGVTLPIKGEDAERERQQLIEKRDIKLLTASVDAPPVSPPADSEK